MLQTLTRLLLAVLLCLSTATQAADTFTPTSAFTDNGDGTVTHSLTGLTWMRCAIGQTWTGSTCSGTATAHTFDQAKALTSTFANHSDWRLPSPWELGTIVDYNIPYPGPTINSTIFPNTPHYVFWSDLPIVPDSAGAWGVYFGYGDSGANGKAYALHVRLVRSGQFLDPLTTPSSDFTDNGDGTVTHKKTQLTWKRCSEGQTWSGSTCSGTASSYTYAQATTLSGTFAGHSDWRLPDVQELRSIVEYGMSLPAINASLFPATPSSRFWSSTSSVPDPAYAWFVNFYSGYSSGDGYKTFTNHVRLVRGAQSSAPLPVAITPTTLTLSAPVTLQSAGRTTLSVSATYSNATSKPVTPTWTSSNPAVASVSTTGELSAGSVTTDTQVTLTATYTEAGATVSASHTLTITAAPATLAGITVAGGTAVASEGLLQVSATATYSDGSTRRVSPSAVSWSVSPATLGSINTRGELTAASVTADTTLTVTASYAEGSATRTATHTITLKATPASLDSLSIVGGQASLASGASLYLGARAGYADNSYKPVGSATWSLSNSSAARITAEGVLTAHTVTLDTPVLVTATYSEGGTTVAARFQIIVIPNPLPPKFATEVIARQDKQSLTRLQLWFNTESGASTRAVRAGTTFKVFVGALLPTGTLVSQPTWFLLNRSSEWQTLSWPLAEYLSGVNSGDWELIELIDAIDTSTISGAQIYVGYGTSDTEMMEAGRYSLVYQVP